MNRVQKIAWAFVIATSVALVVSLVAVGVAYRYVGMPKALAGFCFMGLSGLAGLSPLLIRKDKGPVVADERDRLIQKRAALTGFTTAYLVFGLACMTPFFILGPDAKVSVTWLPVIFMGAGISHYFMYSIAILSQYGLRSNGGATKTCLAILAAGSIMFLSARAVAGNALPVGEINEKIAQLTIGQSTREDVIRVFGEPAEYLWENKTFTEENLPATYIAVYPNDLSFMIANHVLDEIRFEGPGAGYVFAGVIKVGSSLDDVLAVLGQPTRTVVGESAGFLDGVLYKDIDGREGYCYYSRPDWKVRLFFLDYRVAALYLTSGESSAAGEAFGTIHPVSSVEPFDDVRFGDLSKLDLSQRSGLLETLTFNLATVWPPADKLPPGPEPLTLLWAGTNPGLGIRRLHSRGITGKGICVAVIDQPMYLDHPEFAGKIVEYYDTGCGSESSMHGPAVTSLLVGTTCGTAPDANLYYAAAPSWNQDAAYYANALDWIVAKNAQLAVAEKIRVVSVSAAPSGPGSPFTQNNELWDQACLRAAEQGILVLDCTADHGFIGSCWYDSTDPENVAKCTPGFPGTAGVYRGDRVLAPCSVRTVAEEYEKGKCGYQYTGRGGLSWGIPYVAGVLALGWQVNPQATAEQMKQWLFESSYVNTEGAKIIQPTGFIELVKKSQGDTP